MHVITATSMRTPQFSWSIFNVVQLQCTAPPASVRLPFSDMPLQACERQSKHMLLGVPNQQRVSCCAVPCRRPLPWHGLRCSMAPISL